MCIQYDIYHINELQILKNRSESYLCRCDLVEASEFFLGFLCNCLSCFITAKITSIKYTCSIFTELTLTQQTTVRHYPELVMQYLPDTTGTALGPGTGSTPDPAGAETGSPKLLPETSVVAAEDTDTGGK